MFTRKAKTVAGVMAGFHKTINDLQEIIQLTIHQNIVLNEQRAELDEKIEILDLEVHQARGIEGRLNDLVYGVGENI